MTHFQLGTCPALAALVLLSSACAPLLRPEGADAARRELLALQSEPALAALRPSALLDAEAAVRLSEIPTRNQPAGQHAVYVANRKIELARSDAERRIADAELKQLQAQRVSILEETQRRELEIARAQAAAASDAAFDRQQAMITAQEQAASALAVTEELRRQMNELQARVTDRGMVMTLGDLLFETGKADLQPGATERLDKLAGFMFSYVDRTLIVEGHTDSQGSDDNNLQLSARRAELVRAYLVSRGVAGQRITTVGRGSTAPVADNASTGGRQQNRRVDIIISNSLVTAP